METSASTHEHAPPGWDTRTQTAEPRSYGPLLPLLFLGGVLGMYVVIGYAIYALIAALI